MNYDYLMWRRSDRLLRGWIVGTLSEEVLRVVGLKTSVAVWRVLSEYFGRNTKDREFFLMQKMHMHNKQNYKTINDYIRGFKRYVMNLMPLANRWKINKRFLVFSKD